MLAIVPISLSFILSLCYLRRSCRVAATINSSTRRQQEASRTVIIVTLAYILFSTPYTVVMGQFVLKYGLLHVSASPEGLTVQDILDEHDPHYHEPVALVLLISLNSAINPVIYFWRVTHFKTHVLKVWRKKGARGETRGTEVSREPSAAI